VTDSGVQGSLAVYQAFGLRLRSDLPLPELPVIVERGAPPDVEVRLLDTPRLDAATNAVGIADVADDIAMLWWDDIGRFVVSDGSDICVVPAPGADPAAVRLYLLGPVLNALLHQRGWIVLRAGAVKLSGRVVGVVPASACGTFAASGHPVIARDVLAIRAGDHTAPAMVQPCVPWHPQRPMDDAMARRLWCDAGKADPPLKLDALYVFGDREEQLSSEDAFAELGACLFDDLTWPGDVRRALRLLFHLASTLPVHRVSIMAESVATRDLVRDIRG
jgi:hypothetical protein